MKFFKILVIKFKSPIFNYIKILEKSTEQFSQNRKLKISKKLIIQVPLFCYILFRLVFQINLKIFKNFDRRKLKISKKNSKITTILEFSCSNSNENILQHVYFLVIPTIGAMLLVHFVIISYKMKE